MKRYFNTHRIILVIISFCIAAVSIVAMQNLYSFGGDDTRLYYLYPLEMIKNFSSHIITNNTLGAIPSYQPQSMWTPMLLFIYLGKILLPIINTQALFFSLNLILGFIGMYAFLGIWIHEKRFVYIRILSALSYVYSPFLIKSVYVHQLLSMYLVWVTPTILYFFIQSILTKNISLVFAAAIVYSIGSGTILSVPWFGATIFICMPLAAYLLYRSPRRVILHSCIFLASLCVLNLHWIFHMAYSLLSNKAFGSWIQHSISTQIVTENVGMINALSRLNPPYHQLASYLRSSWTERYTMVWSQSYGIISFITVLLGGVFVSQANIQKKKIFVVSLCVLVISLLFITPNFGEWNIQLFVLFNNHIPLFSMFRNMYDKFGPGTAFSYAFALALSLSILQDSIRKSYVRLLSGLLCIFIAISAYGLYQKLYTDRQQNGLSGKFNSDFAELVSYLKSRSDDGRYIWLPLNFPSYVVIEDEKKSGHYYYGTSPIQMVSNTADVTGFLSFATTQDPQLNATLIALFKEKKYEDILSIFQRLNIRYVIVNNDRIPQWGAAHFNELGERDFQTKEFITELLGKKIHSFGTRYDLYEINPQYLSHTLYITTSTESGANEKTPLAYTKVSEGRYVIRMPSVQGSQTIHFQESFNPLWTVSTDKERIHISDHKPDIGFGNAWTLSVSSDDTITDALLYIVFKPIVFDPFVRGISILGYIGMALYIMYSVWKKPKYETA